MSVNDNNLKRDKLKLLISYEDIVLKVKELSKEISSDYTDKPLVIIGLLKGAFIFLADLVRELTIPFHIDFINLSSYTGTTPAEEVSHHYGPDNDIRGKHVLIVEDIIDTGQTVESTVKVVKELGAKDVKVCALLKRESEEIKVVEPDYTGFTIKDGFVVGYGLDYNENHREKKGIYILNKDNRQ